MFSIATSDFTISIRDYGTDRVVWQYISSEGRISVGEAYRERVQHTPQLSYNSAVTITLTNVTRDDDGWYTVALEKTNQQTLVGHGYLTVYVPPHSMRVFVTSPSPYKEASAVSYPPYYKPVYTVKCTFSVYPVYNEVLARTVAIIRRNERRERTYFAVENGNVFDLTLSAQLALTRYDNGERNISCEVTWKRGTDREKIYAAQLETPLNVTFVTQNISTDGLPRTTFTEGETLSATCRAGNANPPHQISWWIKKYINEGNKTTYGPGEARYE